VNNGEPRDRLYIDSKTGQLKSRKRVKPTKHLHRSDPIVDMEQVPEEERATVKQMHSELVDYALDTRNEKLFRKLTNMGEDAVWDMLSKSNNNLNLVLAELYLRNV
jgi:hypothetical protein